MDRPEARVPGPRDGSGNFGWGRAGSRYFRIARDPKVFGIPRLDSGYKQRGDIIRGVTRQGQK